MVTFEWYDIAGCEEFRHCLIIAKITGGSCPTMLRKYLFSRLKDLNKALRSSTLSPIEARVFRRFISKLNNDINFIDEFF